MKYLNILLISMIIGLCVAPLLAEQQAGSGTYSRSESSIDCHCETHEQVKKNTTYIIDCSTSDKLIAKSHVQVRIIPVSHILNFNTTIYYIFPSPISIAESLSLMVDTPPPRLA